MPVVHIKNTSLLVDERVAGFVLALKVAAMKALILVMTMAAIKVWLADPVVLMKGCLASSW